MYNEPARFRSHSGTWSTVRDTIQYVGLGNLFISLTIWISDLLNHCQNDQVNRAVPQCPNDDSFSSGAIWSQPCIDNSQKYAYTEHQPFVWRDVVFNKHALVSPERAQSSVHWYPYQQSFIETPTLYREMPHFLGLATSTPTRHQAIVSLNT